MYKADFIVTLIGKNPLPAYYTSLNYSRENTRLIFVYSEEAPGIISSERVCENLQFSLKNIIKPDNLYSFSSDKSSIKKIESTARRVLNHIISRWDEEDLKDREINVILDYTGGTKAMAAGFYSIFKKAAKDSIYERLKIYSSYISASQGLIYESHINGLSIPNAHKVQDIIETHNIKPVELIELHGFKLINFKGNYYFQERCSTKEPKPITFKEIYINNSNISFTADISIEKTKELVNHYFELSHWAEKLGGSEAEIFINVSHHGKPGDFDKCKFYSSLSSTGTTNIKDKVKLKITENYTLEGVD
ncbi:hypothetical protein [Clostridium polynesiense]|uniref:hypothetical protein n=1 Tax=Clostridium polynesiense TaxID=1325933 RepID=UPI00058DD966|nr:hypothetical protein [Clostridium polynesiense]